MTDPYTSEQLIKLLRDDLAAKAFAQAGNFERLNLIATAELYRTDARMLEAAATRLAQVDELQKRYDELEEIVRLYEPDGAIPHDKVCEMAHEGAFHRANARLSSTRIAPQQENTK